MGGAWGRLFYRVRIHRGRKGDRRSMSVADFVGLITAAHAPVIVIWDNLNAHLSAAMRTFTNAHRDWLTIIQLPAYAADLNPAEGVWANIKNGLGNLAASSIDQLAAIVKNRLKRIQYRPVRCPETDGTHPRTRTAMTSDLSLSSSGKGCEPRTR